MHRRSEQPDLRGSATPHLSGKLSQVIITSTFGDVSASAAAVNDVNLRLNNAKQIDKTKKKPSDYRKRPLDSICTRVAPAGYHSGRLAKVPFGSLLTYHHPTHGKPVPNAQKARRNFET